MTRVSGPPPPPPPDPWGSGAPPAGKEPASKPAQKLPADAFERVAKHAASSIWESAKHLPGVQRVVGEIAAEQAKAATQAKIDGYFERANHEYTLRDGSTVKSRPQFQMNHLWDGGKTSSSEAVKAELVQTLGAKDAKTKQAIHLVAYGRGTPEQVQQLTQKLIDKGYLEKTKAAYTALGKADFEKRFPNTPFPPSDAAAVKLMQFDHGIGIDCAGYVQQEFLAVHGGSRKDWGFQERIGSENLMSLGKNKHFSRVSPSAAQPGDLMALDKPPNDSVGHTVMIRDRHELGAAERAKYPGIDGFAKPGEKIQVFVVEASWGSGNTGDPERGGVRRDTFFFNEATGKWADLRRSGAPGAHPVVQESGATGPYDHPMNGIYHPKGKGG